MTTTSPPILIWQPGGGTPIGPVSNPPVYSQADITQLVIGQAYVDVVFGSIQVDNSWVLVECDVTNTTDLSPLNIWPGLITNRTPAGFRLQLNGMPDSGNYYLHWAVSGVNIVPVPATLYLFTGPTSGPFGINEPFTVKLPPSTMLAVPITITPDDGGAGGTFSPPSVVLSNGSATATFAYNAVAYGAVTISVTNSGTLIDPASIVFTSIAPTYTFSGPTGGTSGVPSTNFTVQLPGDAVLAVPTTVTPSSGGGGGTFTPSSVLLVAGVPVHFTYTPASGGAKTISVTNDGGLTNPGSLSYISTAPFTPDTIAGLKLWLKADALALSDGAAVATWPDSSGSGNNFTGVGSPIYKASIINGKPVVRLNGTTQGFLSSAANTVTGNYTIFFVLTLAPGAGVEQLFTTGASSPAAMGTFAGGPDLAFFQRDPSYVQIVDAAAFAIGVWNQLTFNWDGSNIHIWRNGALKATAATVAISNTGTVSSIGYNHIEGDVSYVAGDIAEVLIYNSGLSTTDRQNVENWLKTKYGL